MPEIEPQAIAKKTGLSKRIGPLPLWGWVVVGGGSGLVLLMLLRKRNPGQNTVTIGAQPVPQTNSRNMTPSPINSPAPITSPTNPYIFSPTNPSNPVNTPYYAPAQPQAAPTTPQYRPYTPQPSMSPMTAGLNSPAPYSAIQSPAPYSPINVGQSAPIFPNIPSFNPPAYNPPYNPYYPPLTPAYGGAGVAPGFYSFPFNDQSQVYGPQGNVLGSFLYGPGGDIYGSADPWGNTYDIYGQPQNPMDLYSPSDYVYDVNSGNPQGIFVYDPGGNIVGSQAFGGGYYDIYGQPAEPWQLGMTNEFTNGW